MKRFGLFLIAGMFVVAAGLGCGRFLVVDAPRKSDVIVVLAGETDHRLERGVQLLDEEFAPRLLLDVPAEDRIYGSSLTDLAQKYVDGLPQGSRIAICPIHAQSTRGETQDVSRCLGGTSGKRILLVTSDFHTRRALSIFSQVAPADYSVSAAPDRREFGVRWWQHRQWAKTNLQEWAKLIWWEVIDRWRS